MFEKLGGTAGIQKIVEDFYHIMETDPLAQDCLATHHGRDLRGSAEKLTAFLSGWTGGPPVYIEKYGHPRLRMRHMTFTITKTESAQWLYCMREAISRTQLTIQEQAQILSAFENVTTMLINRD